MPNDRIPRPTFDADTEAALAEAALVAPDDITRAKQSFRRDASPTFRALLDATPVLRKP